MARFGPVVTAMVTPFDDDLGVDYDVAVSLARWLADHGSSGLVLAGTTGESPTLTDDEKIELFRTVAEAVTVPVLAGVGSADTRHSIELVRAAAATGVAAMLVVTPYYSRPSQAGLFAHFSAVAGASELPVVIYDIPPRTGRKVATDTLVALAREIPNVVAVKDAAANPPEAARLLARTPASFELYSGDDAYTLPLLAVGAVGVISVASHWAGAETTAMIAAFEKGDVAGARAHHRTLLPSFAFEASEEAPNPLPTKAMMRVLGHPVGQCRPPMGPAPAGLEDEARRVHAELQDGAR
ncbi:MAG TPA: 4-hydroxy-tetrahydrodipicolinate synthase [Acidimicrobiales bacterium]|jgi:4-hydroxy-tetrahydrodipicolinate synthase|nr:4-hydroxy-tetrahydrodipicolinate synthase [Acidimicrobiales bacterium]